jgi:hypothetical protein
MDCIITIKGNGVGRYGKPKKDRTGPVREFVVDNQYFYNIIYRHLKECDKCNPEEILRLYLARRIHRGDQMVTGLLVELAMKYARHFKIDPALIIEYKWRCGIHKYEYRKDLALYDLAKAVAISVNSGYCASPDPSDSDAVVIDLMIPIIRKMDLDDVLEMNEKSSSELKKLIDVASVMVT